MKAHKNYFWILTAATLLGLGPLSCSSIKPKPTPANDALQTYKTSHGLRIAVVPLDANPNIVCVAYDKGRGRAAAKGAGELGKKGAIGGLQLPFYMLVQCNDPRAFPIVLVALPVLVPVCGLGGAIIGTSAGAIGGAVKGDYVEKPMMRTEALASFARKVSSMVGFNLNLAHRMTKAGEAMTDNKFTIISQQEAAEGCDAVLDVGIARLIFKGELESDPDIAFEAVVRIEMTDASQQIVYSHVYNYTSNEISFSKWNKQQGRPLHKQFDRFYQVISEKVIEDLFVENKRPLVDAVPE